VKWVDLFAAVVVASYGLKCFATAVMPKHMLEAKLLQALERVKAEDSPGRAARFVSELLWAVALVYVLTRIY
jgi:hypothetical protein